VIFKNNFNRAGWSRGYYILCNR